MPILSEIEKWICLTWIKSLICVIKSLTVNIFRYETLVYTCIYLCSIWFFLIAKKHVKTLIEKRTVGFVMISFEIRFAWLTKNLVKLNGNSKFLPKYSTRRYVTTIRKKTHETNSKWEIIYQSGFLQKTNVETSFKKSIRMLYKSASSTS